MKSFPIFSWSCLEDLALKNYGGVLSGYTRGVANMAFKYD